MTNNDSIAKRIIERRAELEMSQNELASSAKVAPAQISRYEAGKNLPRPKVIARLAEALAVPYGWLAYGTGREKPEVGSKTVDLHFTLPSEYVEFMHQVMKEKGITKEEFLHLTFEYFKENTLNKKSD